MGPTTVVIQEPSPKDFPEILMTVLAGSRGLNPLTVSPTGLIEFACALVI